MFITEQASGGREDDRGTTGRPISANRGLSGLRVAFVAGTLGQGGAERQLFYILKALCENGALARVLSLSTGEFWEEKISALGVPVIWVGREKSKAARLRAIVRELRRDPPDIVQSQHFYTNLYTLVSARLLGLREVAAIRNTVEFSIRDTGALVGRLSLRGPRRIAANSRAAIREALDRGVPASRLYFLPNVVDTERFLPKPGQNGGKTEVRLLAVGRLAPQKRFDRFLEVVARLRQQAATVVTGRIAGSGPLREELQRKAEALGLLPGGVEFLGSVTDMRAVYRESDVLLLTSDFEGTPNVVLEAMASGLPVVATRVGGLSEIIRSGETGYLIEPGDDDALNRVLSDLITYTEKRSRIGLQARLEMVENASVDRLPRLLAELYGVNA